MDGVLLFGASKMPAELIKHCCCCCMPASIRPWHGMHGSAGLVVTGLFGWVGGLDGPRATGGRRGAAVRRLGRGPHLLRRHHGM